MKEERENGGIWHGEIDLQVGKVCIVQPSPLLLCCVPLQCTEKLRMKESHIAQLSNTVERMLKESNDRMRAMAEERKTMMAEKVGACVRAHTHTSTHTDARFPSLQNTLTKKVALMDRKLLKHKAVAVRVVLGETSM